MPSNGFLAQVVLCAYGGEEEPLQFTVDTWTRDVRSSDSDAPMEDSPNTRSPGTRDDEEVKRRTAVRLRALRHPVYR